MSDIENDGENGYSNQQVKLLIERRLDMENQFSEGKRKKSVLWKVVHTNILKIDPSFPLGVEAAKCKFYNLYTTYKRVKKRNNTSGNKRTNWPYYEMFDEIFGSRHSIAPPQENIMSTFNLDGDEMTSEIFELEEPIENSTPSPNKRTKKKNEKEDTLKFLKTMEQKEDQRHKDFIDLENKKIDVEVQKVEAIKGMSTLLQQILNKQMQV